MFEPLFGIGLAAFIVGAIVPLATIKMKNNKLPRQAALLLGCFASIALLAFAAEVIFTDSVVSAFTYQIASLFEFSFTIDRLSGFFIALVSVVSLAVEIYSLQYVEHMHGEDRKNLLAFLMNAFIVSMVLVIASCNNVFFFVFLGNNGVNLFPCWLCLSMKRRKPSKQACSTS